jgi:hypothetical protein
MASDDLQHVDLNHMSSDAIYVVHLPLLSLFSHAWTFDDVNGNPCVYCL